MPVTLMTGLSDTSQSPLDERREDSIGPSGWENEARGLDGTVQMPDDADKSQVGTRRSRSHVRVDNG
jgi:hypothetical protein